MPHEAVASVYLAARRVGTLGYRDGSTWFDYEDFDYEDIELGHPVLGQAFEIDPQRRRTASGGVPEWFANLLPEPGSGLRGLIARELGRKRVHDFLLLVHLGCDLPGAVRVVRESNGHDIPELIEADPCAHDHPLRFSLAGVQPKFSMHHEGKGLALPATGQGGDWIVKLPDRRFPHVPENEHAMLTWARLSGIDVPDNRLVTGAELSGLPDGLIASQEYALAIRRFDRTAEARVHQEDFAQVRETSVDAKYDSASYAGLGRIINVLTPVDLGEYIERLVAVVVMGNLDAHLKNWTLRYPDGHTPRLSPAYDLVAVAAYPEFREDVLAFDLGGTRIARLITVDHFRRLAGRLDSAADGMAAAVKGMVERLADTWPQVRRDCPVPGFVAAHIEERLRSLPLVHGR
jgi:serine/threonine-protein kinase HipA